MGDFVDVVLTNAGRHKTAVILACREATTTETILELVDLAAAKRLTDSTPCVVVPNVPFDLRERVKASLEKAGATVELKPA
jgi:ribosomal protein L7/L12